MDDSLRERADRTRALVEAGRCDPPAFRAALLAEPFAARDAWVDRVFGIDGLAEDGPDLPRGCVPYLPSAVDTLLRLIDHAPVRATDVLVDVGSGVGRAATLVHLLTGATVRGIEVQRSLVAAARALVTRVCPGRVTFVQGDGAHLTGPLTEGSVFFLYCPFSGERLVKVLDCLEPLARARAIRVCCVDLPLPPCGWLTPLSPLWVDLAIYRTVT